jgi:hypothetical protein
MIFKNKGIWTNKHRIKIIPVKKSIQLPKSFKSPIKDLIKRASPKKIKINEGISVKIVSIRINPENASIPPKILTNMFFKPRYYLKKYQQSVLSTNLKES